jgi:hypothetical protein
LNTSPPSELHDQLERLQSRLSTRDSILHFAHAAVSVLVAAILAAAGWKMNLDGVAAPSGHLAPLGVAGVLTLYAATRTVWGLRALKRELVAFESLKSLRRTLQLDDPSALLPKH